MRYVVWTLVVALVILHQDFWLWTDERLLLGFLPIGLGYHIGISLAAATTWLLACIFAWPADLEAEAEQEAAAHAQEGGSQ